MREAIGRVWRRILWWRFRLFQRRRYDRLVLERVGERPFLILPQVFNPTLFLTSEFMVTALTPRLVPPGARVLDMGTGAGVGAVFAAQWAGRVTAVDVNPAAVRCARINALLNEVDDRVDVRLGDLFTPVAGERFDVVLFNPPYLPGAPRDMLDRAFRGPDVLPRFAAQLDAHLLPGGTLLLLLSSLADEAGALRLFTAQGFGHEVAARRALPGERVTLWRLRREPT